MATACPLDWPPGYKRTKVRLAGRFRTSFTSARDGLSDELDRLGAKYPIISTNIELKANGMPYAGRANPEDPGVAVYFELTGRTLSIACDRWTHIQDNLQAIRLTVAAMRGLDRWGVSQMMDRMFRGFAQLQSGPDDWRNILAHMGDTPDNLIEVNINYRLLAAELHPDRGGSHEKMSRLNQARDNAIKELGGSNGEA